MNDATRAMKGSTSFLVFDGASVLYVLTICVTVMVLFFLFMKRQVLRLRINSSRKVPEVRLKMMAPKKICDRIDKRLVQVNDLRQSYLPKFTDCLGIQPHCKKSYLNRMIAVDEILMEIDEQIKKINADAGRQPGESIFKYLTRLKTNLLTELPVTLIHRIAYLYEAARYRPQRFDVEQLMEVRSLLQQFRKIVSSSNLQLVTATPERKSALSQIRARAGGSVKRHRSNPFGGSDGGRWLVQSGFVNSPREGTAEENIALLPMGSSSSEATPKRHIRRCSDQNLLSQEY